MTRRLIVSVSLLCLSAGAGFAQGTSADRAACTPDVFRLCASEIPDVGAIVACLKQAKPQLSAGCRTVMDAADKAPQTTATRSLEIKPGWCRFDGSEPADDDWRTWCGHTGAN